MSLLVLGFESSCDETGVALVQADAGGAVEKRGARQTTCFIRVGRDEAVAGGREI